MNSESQNVIHSIFRAASLFAIAAMMIMPAVTNAQATPNPPGLLCVDGSSSCDDTGTPPGGTSDSKKWNPGHYIKPQGNHASGDKEAFYTSITNQLAKTEDSPEIRGALITYSWGMVEPTLGNYDFSPIYQHLDYLAARGKKAILSINAKCFGTDCGSLAPADLQSEVYVTPKERPTSIIELWEDQNMDLYIRLWDELAAEFDDHPAVEMVLGAESTPSLAGSNPAGFSKGVYAEQLKRLYSAQSAGFKKTNVIGNINFLSGEVSGLIEHALQVGVGRGMPDIFDSDGSLIFRGECEDKECGIRDYRGMIPHFGVASYQQLIGKFSDYSDDPPETIEYGIENKITHYAWVTNESGEDSWPNIISAIESANPDGHTACPTAYTKGCQ